MKNTLNFSFIFFLFTLFGFAQHDSLKVYKSQINSNSNKNFIKKPILVVDGKLIDNEYLDKIVPDNIKSITVLRVEKAISKFGVLAANGVLLVETKGISRRERRRMQDLYQLVQINNSDKKVFQLKGKIYDCEEVPISSARVFNLNSSVEVVTDSLGNFEIPARIDDVLNFTCLGYESTRELIVSEKLKNVFLKSAIDNNTGIMVKKPVIYLYPEKTTEVDFKFNFKGKLLTTFPKYDTSWKITAYPDGKIFDKKTNRFYNSLFWDGEMAFPSEHYDYKSGFVVAKKDLTSFLIQKLEHIGLNTNETNDFIQFWLPILEKNELNFIHFLVNSDYDSISTNDINPKPDTNLRVFMEFYSLEEYIQIEEQKLPKTNRIGFTLVEWGGSDVSQNSFNKYNILK
ncbi:MAG: hypothetical protein O9267_02780 [Flavobacterium sp.]|uniref:hypothetical protein n=1 Tax=Flavobacterium sp. TaxID=239 RepID=UPI0022C92739|nr:hypothetical protein [Flavobacterium sp.]MCZ8196518.1 hypothetical protein [Flavobacterium sp.]